MKSFIIVVVMSLSLEAFAQKKVELDEVQEKVCYEQAKKVGCVKGNETADPTCTKSNKSKFTTNCRQIFGIE